jgi:pyruvate dehydrogenase E2 component (dihydrolipoamide acetyltransferase)
MATEVVVPPLGTTVDTVTLVKWYAQEGEPVTQGEALFAVETDKATLDVEAPASGILWQVLAQPGDVVAALSQVAVIGAPGEAVTERQVQAAVAPSAGGIGPARGPTGDRRVEMPGRAARIFISPRARQLAEEHGIAIEGVAGTGPEGAIVERDVRAALDSASRPRRAATPVAQRIADQAGLAWQQLAGSGTSGRVTRSDVRRALEASVPAAEEDINTVAETIPLRGVRAITAERMGRSHTEAARVTLTAQADATALVALREQLVRDGIAVSYNDLFISVAARALCDHPRLNASLQGEEITVWQRIHIGLAVDTERGLLVPVVRDADQLKLAELAAETHALIERARAGRSTPRDLSGGTFTVTNLGMFGIDVFTPIINLPECAILGVGRISLQPVLAGDRVVGRQLVWLSLAFDHRLVNGGPAARCLQRIVQLVEKPHLLLA